MRRGKVLSILTVLLVFAGIACVTRDVSTIFSQIGAQYTTFIGAALLLLGATAGFLTITIFRKDCRRLTAIIQNVSKGERPGIVDAGDSELVPLVASINELVSFAEHSVTDAAMKLKEMEIQLKVATAQRQHAEAILYSISDAVLVTDVFDELVLANEAAARTFDFDLQKVHATRGPVGMSGSWVA